MNKRLVLAQFGCGYWGPNLLRNFSVLPDCSVKYVADKSADRRAFVERNFPQTRAVESCDAVLDDPEIDAVIIATPAGRSRAAFSLQTGHGLYAGGNRRCRFP